MRAMILAAGLGTRMDPLSRWLPKPALPVRGIPVVTHLLELLRHQGVTDVMVNLHHLPDAMREATLRHRPGELSIHFSQESSILGTGGAIRRVRDFLSESDPFLVLAGDMLLDADLAGMVRRHREREDLATLLLRRDDRAARFGTIGTDGDGAVRRIGDDFDLGDATRAGVFVGVRCIAARTLDSLPDRDRFEDLRDWLAPLIRRGETGVRGELHEPEELTWEPVGTPVEYLDANLDPPRLSFFDPDRLARARGVRLGPDWVAGRGAHLGEGAQLKRVVVWDDESVPDGADLRNGVFAAGSFHAVDPSSSGACHG